MDEQKEPSPIPRRHGWRLLGLIVLGLGLLGIGTGFWWYHDDSDLEAIRAKAREQGRPLVWSGLGLTLPDAERLRLWQRCIDLAKQVTAFQSQLGPDGKSRYKPWEPIPDEMRAHHAAMDATIIAELVSVLDHLGDRPLVLHDQISYTRALPEIGVARSLNRFLQERLILSEPHEVGTWARRMLAACRRFTVDTLIQHMVHNGLLEATLSGISIRLDDLKQDDPAIADEILETLRPRHDNLLRALDGEFLMMLDVVERPGVAHFFNDDSDEWYMPLVMRAGRHGALGSQLDAIQDLRRQKPTAALAWSRALDAKVAAARSGLPYPSRILEGMFMPAWGMVVSQGELVALRGRVIAAELQDSPWPVDVFDPTSAPVRAIRRDGKVIAAYSVHTDGVDQGGDEKRDRIIPLYAKP